MDYQTKKVCKYLILPLLLLTAAIYAGRVPGRADSRMHIEVYDMGSGKSELVRTYSGRKILIDGGSTNAVLRNIGQDLDFYDHALDLVILTTPDTAHVSGLIDVAKRYEIGRVLLPLAPKYNASYDEFVTMIGNRRIPTDYLKPGQRVWLDASTVLDIRSVTPFAARLTFGGAGLDLPPNETGRFVSDGKSLYKK